MTIQQRTISLPKKLPRKMKKKLKKLMEVSWHRGPMTEGTFKLVMEQEVWGRVKTEPKEENGGWTYEVE